MINKTEELLLLLKFTIQNEKSY